MASSTSFTHPPGSSGGRRMIAAAASSSSRVASRSAGSRRCSKRSVRKWLTCRLHVNCLGNPGVATLPRRRPTRCRPLLAREAIVGPIYRTLCRAQIRQRARPDLFLHQRTFALVERTPRLLRWDGRELLVVVPGRLALLRLLHLEQVHRVELAPVDTHVALAHELVLGRQ